MKRLYKIIILFLIIFGVGIYFTVKSINNSFTTTNEVETVSSQPRLLNLSTKL
ncbi:hypothetical protein SAMN05444411_10156 [Lutibacter oricola]|uniref:Uncharacterized protein n=1 Tax=Lutibacter oricola TaxID=762486 RepID=A0A1H2QQQ6_9FLAO|nr:hypothetical protein SAMN05444411_10156 [Lutibacter oricola]